MENLKFVVAEQDEQPKYYTSRTAATGELTENLQQALVFEEKALARSAMAMYQSQFPEKEIAVVNVVVKISLT